MNDDTRGSVSYPLPRNWADWVAMLLFVFLGIAGLFQLSMMDTGANLSITFEALLGLCLIFVAGLIVGRTLSGVQRLRYYRDVHTREQALKAMFSTMRHDLDNDMQVVLGNAELAGDLLSKGQDASRSVVNIQMAAKVASERIEQLALFKGGFEVNKTSLSINALLRRCTACLVTELPAIVTLKVDLGLSDARVRVDERLLSTSLIHIGRQAVKSMPHGGEISVRSSAIQRREPGGKKQQLCVELIFIRALRHGNQDGTVNTEPRSLDNDEPIELSESSSSSRSSLHGRTITVNQFDRILMAMQSILSNSGVDRVSFARSTNESRLCLLMYLDGADESRSSANLLDSVTGPMQLR